MTEVYFLVLVLVALIAIRAISRDRRMSMTRQEEAVAYIGVLATLILMYIIDLDITGVL